MPQIDGKNVPFGLADITIGEGAEAINFNGVDYLQAEGGELNLSPILEEIKMADFGDSVYDDILNGFEGTLTIVAGNRDLKILSLAMAYSDKVMDTVETDKIASLHDAKHGTSMRGKAKKVKIHPRHMGTDTSHDINIYKMAGVSEFNQNYENAQGNNEIELKIYPRDGADPNSPGNFYYTGDTDPNA